MQSPDLEQQALHLSSARLLSKVDLFTCLDPASLVQLSEQMVSVVVPSGTEVLRQNEPGDCVYIVSHGTFGVYVASQGSSEETRVATIGPGEYMGEMALLAEQPRSATVRAEEDGELLRLERGPFESLLNERPGVALTVIGALSERLRAADAAVADLAECARLMAENKLTRERAACLEMAMGADQVSRLTQLFGRMAQAVMTREEELHQEVRQLRIEIDSVKAQRSVEEIATTDYFQALQRKVKARRRTRGNGEAGTT